MDKLGIVKMAADQKRAGLVSKAREMGLELVNTAKQIQAAVEAGDLQRLVWVIRSIDPVLAAQIEACHEQLHFLTGLEKA